MQNRNFIKFIAILFSLICIYQLSFTWKAGEVEEDAIEYADIYIENNKDELISKVQQSSNDSLINLMLVSDKSLHSSIFVFSYHSF